MSAEEQIVEKILVKFPYWENKITVQRPGRIVSPTLIRDHFEQAFEFMVQQLGFNRFHLVIGVDDGDDLGFIYVISNDDHVIMMLKQRVSKSEPVISSVCKVFPNALWHERELVDLFGAIIENLPPGPSYPLPDGWPEGNYPMRKEWKVEFFDRETLTYNPPTPKADAEKEASHE